MCVCASVFSFLWITFKLFSISLKLIVTFVMNFARPLLLPLCDKLALLWLSPIALLLLLLLLLLASIVETAPLSSTATEFHAVHQRNRRV